MENSIANLSESGGAITNDTCVPNSALGEIIPPPVTKLAEVGGGISCDRTLDTQAAAWVGATKQISTNTTLALARQATLREEATLEQKLRQK